MMELKQEANRPATSSGGRTDEAADFHTELMRRIMEANHKSCQTTHHAEKQDERVASVKKAGDSGEKSLEIADWSCGSPGRHLRRAHLSHWKAQSGTHHFGPLERLCVAILLPFLCLFLLPTIRVERQLAGADDEQLAKLWHTTNHAAGDLLMALVRLPLDRMRLQSGGLIPSAWAKEISSKSDLQEEETHMLLLAPAEHRTTYVAAPQAAQGYQYGADSAGPQHELHAQVAPQNPPAGSLDYGAPDEHTGVAPAAGQAQGETSAVSEASPTSGGPLQARSDLPAVRALNVKCEKNHMTVNIVFDRPFYGMVFSKGHYNDQKCVHLPPNSGQTSINFDIHLGKCGMSSSDATPAALGAGATALQQANGGTGQQQQQQPNGVYIENTIIIQYDPLVQEIFDQARKLRCTWYDYYEKSVTFRPYNVDMLDAVTANFLGDNIQCWMQIQVGKGPWSSEVAGIVKIGQTMTMVLAIKDDENRFDMLVRNCVAHDGKHQPIQLVDEYGCVARPKIMGKFQKVRNFGPAATVVSYAHFQAFKFPDSMSVHFQCVIQVCRYECPEPVCNQPAELAASAAGSAVPAGQLGGGGGGPNDYAAAGTEMVASKESLPPASYFNSAHNVAGSLVNHSHGSNVNLKLDESQGRVQVKLDTSMMAGLNGRPPQTLVASSSQQLGGPLPPHLLHMAGSSSPGGLAEPTGGRNYAPASSAYYRPVVATSSGSSQQAAAAVIASAPTGGAGLVSRQHLQPAVISASRSQQLNAAAPSVVAQTHQSQVLQYSPQYGASAAARRSSAYANRMGELESEGDETEHQQPPPPPPPQQSQRRDEHLQITPPYEAEYPLSLLGSPRGLKLGVLSASSLLAGAHHRVKRHQQPEDKGPAKRARRHLKAADSTSVQTQKTIQVVSPDDVAFSLLDPSEEFEAQLSPVSGGKLSPRARPGAVSSSVCFSTARFLWGVLVTLAALFGSIVIVTYVILKQRSQLHQKLSSVFVGAEPQQQQQSDQMAYCGLESTPSPALSDQHHLQQQHKILSAGSRLNLCQSAPMSRAQQQHQQHQQHQHRTQRQHDEMEQRETYLSRLYSQFAPANYWR